MAKIELKRSECQILHNILMSLKAFQASKEFVFKIAMLKTKIKPVIDSIQEAIAPIQESKELQEYDQKRLELCTRYADKNEDGSPKVTPVENGGTQYSITDKKNKIEFAKESEKLNEKYKASLEKLEADKKEIENFLKGTVSIEYEPISFSTLPETFDIEKMETLLPFIEQ